MPPPPYAALAELLAPGVKPVAARLKLAAEDEDRYRKRFRARRAERNVEDQPVDLFLELTDAVGVAGHLCGVDWKFAAHDVEGNLRRVLKKKKLPADRWLAFYDEDAHLSTKTLAFIGLCGRAFSAHGWSLVEMDISSDSHELTVVPRARLAEAQKLARALGGAIVHHGPAKPLAAPLPPAPRKKPAARLVSLKVPGADHDGFEGLESGFLVPTVKDTRIVDCRRWPPRQSRVPSPKADVVERPGGGARIVHRVWHPIVDGAFTAKAIGTLVVETGRARVELIDRLPPWFDPWGAGFAGGRVVIFPTEPTVREGTTRRPLVWDGKKLQPAPGLPDAKPVRGNRRDAFPSFIRRGFARTGDGTELVIWEGRGWVLGKGGRFVPVCTLVAAGTYDPIAGVPAESDAFFYLAPTEKHGGTVMREVRLGGGARGTDVERGRVAGLLEHPRLAPDGTVVAASNRSGDARKPVLVAFHPSSGEWTEIPAGLFGVRKDDAVDAFGFGEASGEPYLWILDGQTVKRLAWSQILGLPRTRE